MSWDKKDRREGGGTRAEIERDIVKRKRGMDRGRGIKRRKAGILSAQMQIL